MGTVALFGDGGCRGTDLCGSPSDGWPELRECGGQPERRCGVDGELVVALAEVLDEGVPSDHHARRPVGLESAHGPESGLQPAMVALDAVARTARCCAA